MFRCLFDRFLLGLLFLSCCNLSFADTVWPKAPVHIVVPFPPGGSNDVIARRLSVRLTQTLGQPVIVENKGGGAGSIGAQAVAISPADGYTFLFVSSSLATASAVQKTPYDPATSFAAVARVARAPFIILTRTGFGPKSVPELVAYARANPGKINYGSAGPGDTTQMATELFNETVGVKMTAVPYKGIAPAAVPVAVRDKMNREINSILIEPDFVAFLKNAGASAAPTTPAAFQEILTKDVERWNIIAKRAGVQ